MFINTNSKKVVSAIMAAAFVFSMFAGVAMTPAAHADTTMATYTFSNNLTVGSRGADVVALQSWLVANGFLVMPSGVAMGYFGSLTRAAVGKFQASVGISPTAGYFGPITRAYLNSHQTASAGGNTTCPAGYTCSPVNGGAVCPAGYTCSPVSGGTTSSNGAGVLTVTQGPPGGNSNIQTNVDVPVYGLNLRAQLGSIRVDQLDLDVSDSIASSPVTTENPGAFINNIKVWDGSTILLNRNVSAADFVSGTSSTDYHILLSGINFMVPANTTKTLTVSFSTGGSIDTQRTLVIRGYNSTSLRYFDSSNVASYADISSFSTTQAFVKPGTASITVGLDASNPLSMTNYTDPNSTVTVPLEVFDVNNTQGSSVVTQVIALVNATMTAPTAVSLWQGGTQLSYKAISSTGNTSITFDNLQNFAQSSGAVFTIKLDMPSTSANGAAASSTVTSVTVQNSSGTNQTVTPALAGYAQYFYKATPQLAFNGGTATVNNDGAGNDVSANGVFHLSVTPKPGSMIYPLASDFVVKMSSSTAASSNAVTATTNLVFTGNNIPNVGQALSANTTYTFDLNVSNASAVKNGSFYTFFLTSASTTVQDYQGNNVQTTQTWGLSNFKTPSAYGL